jgi:hypothetical protein
MRTALPHLDKPELPEKRDDFARFQDWRLANGLRHFDGLCADEDAVESRIAFLEEHFDHFPEIGTQFVEGLALAVRAGKTWHPPHVQTGVRVSFDDGGEVFHDATPLPWDDTRSLTVAPAWQTPPNPLGQAHDASRHDDVRFWADGLQQLMTGDPDTAASVFARANVA